MTTSSELQTIPPAKADAVTIFKTNVARQEHEFRAALPAHIPVERFARVLTTAVVNNPSLLDADRRSLFEAAMKAAQDGLLPDGREGALVIFNAKIKGQNGAKDQWVKKVQWMPMIAGILKKVRNSGELLSIAAHVAYGNDDFAYELGDEERIAHRPALGDRGTPRLVYAIAKTKDGGIYREIMTVADVEKVRSVSRSKDDGPWASWWDEMARKTVLRRLSKRLPMSSDLDDLIRREDDEPRDTPYAAPLIVSEMTAQDRLTAKLDALAAGANGNGEPPHDPDTGEIIHSPPRPGDGSETGGTIIMDAAKLEDLEAAEPIVPAAQRLLDEAHEKAKGGAAIFKRWESRLNAPDYALIEGWLSALRAEAAAASA